MMKRVRQERAATVLAQTAAVQARLFPLLQAAKQRVAARKLLARRRVAGAFRVVFCLTKAFRGIRKQREERVISALYLSSRLVQMTKPWLERARECLREAEKRRQREEERRRQELEQRLREEEERLRKESEERRLREEERLREEAERRRKEEEEERERVEAERLRKEEERKEQERLRLEEEERLAEVKREEEERRVAEEKRKLEEERLEMQAAKEKAEAEVAAQREAMLAAAREEIEAERRRMAQEMEETRMKEEQALKEEKERLQRERSEIEDTKSRLSLAPSRLGMMANASLVSAVIDENIEEQPPTHSDMFDIGDSASVLPVYQEKLTADTTLEELVKQAVEKQVSEKIERKEQSMKEEYESLQLQAKLKQEALQQEILQLQAKVHEKDKCLEEKEAAGASRGPPAAEQPECERSLEPEAVDVSHLEYSPPPTHEPQLAACSPSPTRLPGASRKYSLASGSHPSLNDPLASASAGRARRKSVAVEALQAEVSGHGRPRPLGSQNLEPASNATSNANQQLNRKWWSEQRSFLMEDLYQAGSLATPMSNKVRRESRIPRPLPEMPEDASASFTGSLFQAFEGEARQADAEAEARANARGDQLVSEGADEAVEWVCDVEQSQTQAKSQLQYRGKDGKPRTNVSSSKRPFR